jgi:hypothetical protein
MACAQHPGSFGQGHPIDPAHEVQHIAGCPAAEAVKPLPFVEDGEAGRSVGMERAAPKPFRARCFERHQLASDVRQGVGSADCLKVNHCEPP